MVDLYAVIGCKSTSTAAELKKAYHRYAAPAPLSVDGWLGTR